MVSLSRSAAKTWYYSCIRRTPFLHRSSTTITTRADSIYAGDRVLLRYRNKNLQLTQPLKADGSIATHLGIFKHADIIGKNSRDVVRSHKGFGVRIHVPTLAEYVTMTPRIVTPIYPADANLITSLLDIHASPSYPNDQVPLLEILEAGTGQGALTLYLAKAIHAANPLPSVAEEAQSALQSSLNASQPEIYKKMNRRAIVHTVDVRYTYSEHAKNIVYGFRRGMYANNVEFYVGDVSEWIDQQILSRRRMPEDDKTFLSHAILDIPDANKHVEKAASVLKINGNLLVFSPSISQIMSVVDLVQRENTPLLLSAVLELGHNMTGGREWDVRTVVPRAQMRNGGNTTSASSKCEGGADYGEVIVEGEEAAELSAKIEFEHRVEQATQASNSDVQMVCRPKVGGMIKGGGFVSVWKKMKDNT